MRIFYPFGLGVSIQSTPSNMCSLFFWRSQKNFLKGFWPMPQTLGELLVAHFKYLVENMKQRLKCTRSYGVKSLKYCPLCIWRSQKNLGQNVRHRLKYCLIFFWWFLKFWRQIPRQCLKYCPLYFLWSLQHRQQH